MRVALAALLMLSAALPALGQPAPGQAVPGQSAVQPAPRFPVDSETGRAIGAKETAPDDLKRALDQGEKVVIIDIRNAAAFEKETLPGAIHIPLGELEARLKEFPKDTKLVFT